MKRSVCALILFVSAAFAQPPSSRHIEGLAKRLALDASQKERATALYTEADTSAKTLHAPMKQAHEALQLAVQNNDAVGIDRAALQIGTLSAQEMSIRSKADAAFRQGLSTEQRAAFDKMHMRGGPGPQGPRRPPPTPVVGQ